VSLCGRLAPCERAYLERKAIAATRKLFRARDSGWACDRFRRTSGRRKTLPNLSAGRRFVEITPIFQSHIGRGPKQRAGDLYAI
jgi:hypothetical protein